MPESHYRADIDGLRAVAVSLVLLFHAYPKALPGGFIGVDVFFVISGYLITGIIRDQKAKGTFSLAHFYERRIRRIFPALFVVLAFTYVCGWLLLLPAEFAQLGTNLVAGAAFLANISLWHQAGYFDIEALQKPLLHLWSLGIEEQFYIAWPVLLLIAARFRNGALVMIASTGIISFVLNLALVRVYPEATFYLPFTRAWELLAGAFLTYSRIEFKKGVDVVALLGLVLIVATAISIGPKSSFPGWRAALPVIGTALLIASSTSFINRHILGARVMVGLGLISYPLYLWHWPVLVYGHMISEKFNDTKRFIAVVCCVGLAWATYRVVETPIRTGQRGGLKVTWLAAAMSSVALIAGWTIREAGLPSRFPIEVRSILQASVQAERWRRHECIMIGGDASFADTCIDKGDGPLVFLWGDSTAAALVPGLRDLQQKHFFRLAQFTISSCEPLLSSIGGSYCEDMNRKVLAVLERDRPQTVLLEAVWYPTPEHLDGLAATIEKLRQLAIKRIVVLGRVPDWPGGLPRNVFNFYRLNFHTLPTRIRQPEKEKWYDAKMRERLEPLGATFVSAWDAMCDVAEGCIVRLPDVNGRMDLSATDVIHLSEAGSAYLVEAIQAQILPP